MLENNRIFFADAYKISSVFANLEVILKSIDYEEVKSFIWIIFYKSIQFGPLMVNWNNGLSLKITAKGPIALETQIFGFYESITRPPNVDPIDLLPSNENKGEISNENYILRIGLICFCSFGFCCRINEPIEHIENPTK